MQSLKFGSNNKNNKLYIQEEAKFIQLIHTSTNSYPIYAESLLESKMNSLSSSPIVLKTKISPSISWVCESPRDFMSTSLRERLKKSGRYHPGTSLLESPTNTATLADSQLYSPNSRTNEDLNACIPANEVSTNQYDNETPKRRSSEAQNSSITKNSVDIIKRRKIEYTETTPNKVSGVGHQSEGGSHLSSSSQELDNSKFESLKKIKDDLSVVSYSDMSRSDLNNGSSTPDESYASLKNLKIMLENDMKVKEEQLRKLKMVKMYNEKNNLTELQRLINIWRDVSQRALVDLHDLQPPPKPSMTDLINHLHIDHEIISYDVDEECFS